MYERHISRSERETFELGEKLAQMLKNGDIVTLSGMLGAGKTVFAKGIAAGLGIKDEITSPTFTLLKEYEGRLKLHHFDLYRIEDEDALWQIGFYDYLGGEGVCVVEWPDIISLPSCIRVSLQIADDNIRRINIISAKDNDEYTGR